MTNLLSFRGTRGLTRRLDEGRLLTYLTVVARRIWSFLLTLSSKLEKHPCRVIDRIHSGYSMIDFNKYSSGGGSGPLDPTDLLKLFESLDRFASHTELRKAQVEACQILTNTRQRRDTVLKVSTGAGKTTLGLLYLRSLALEKQRPVVYLCPNTQLVAQVLAEAKALGIAAVDYPGSEPHVDPTGMSGEAIIVCTYKKLFTARTTFDRDDVHLSPSALVLDDAHAGIEEVRDAFTIRFEYDNDLATRMRKLFEAPLRSAMPGVWSGVEREDPAALLEVPYWIWRTVLDQVRDMLADHMNDEELRFVWGHLRDRLELCRCIIGGAGIEIAPDVPPVEHVRAYNEANHRLFTSATLADDSALVRELGCDPNAALDPVQPASDAGVGERMVLAPTLIDKSLNREWVMSWCAAMSKHVRVVVLTSSGAAAKQWAKHGATVATGTGVDSAIAQLRSGTLSFAAFPSRYDGVDLPDDACRVLVLDGVPYGESLTTKHDATIPGRPSASQNRVVHRIEQGMGRAVRSHVDYAVVILCGPELASFVSRTEILELFNPATRAQLRLARRLAEISLAEPSSSAGPHVAFHSLARACIGREQSWKGFYDTEVRQIANAKRPIDTVMIHLAAAEREAAKKGIHDPGGAASIIEQAARLHASANDQRLGWYLQVAASYRYSSDQATAFQLQAAAYLKNDRMLPPPRGVSMRPIDPGRAEAPAAILRWYARFDNPNGAVATVQALRARLSFGVSSEVFEQAICDLAEIVGAKGLRPEKTFGKGPDDLWLWADRGLVIECKNEEDGDTLPKRDSGQLHDSLQWFRENFPTWTAIPLLVAAADESHEKANFPSGTRVITPTTLSALLDAVENFVAMLAKQPPAQWTANSVGQLASRQGVASDQFVGRYTTLLD